MFAIRSLLRRLKFDPQATMYINTQVVRDFIKVLGEPLGFGREPTDFVPEEEMNSFIGKVLGMGTVCCQFG